MVELDDNFTRAIVDGEMTYKAESVMGGRTGTFASCGRVATPVMQVRHTCLSVTAHPFKSPTPTTLDGGCVVLPGVQTRVGMRSAHRHSLLTRGNPLARLSPN